jgi:hypothetical protein
MSRFSRTLADKKVSLVGLTVGLAATAIGVALVPALGAVGVLWSVTAGANTLYHAYHLWGERDRGQDTPQEDYDERLRKLSARWREGDKP